MRILDILWKDLTEIFRDKKSLIYLVAMPIVFTLFMGFAFQPVSSSGVADNRLPIAIVDQTGRPTGSMDSLLASEPPAPRDQLLSASLAELLSASSAVKVQAVDSETKALALLKDKKVSAALVIPKGFGEVGVPLKLVTETASTTGQSIYQALRSPVFQALSASQIAEITVEQLSAKKPAEFDERKQTAAAYGAAFSQWKTSNQTDLITVERATRTETKNPFGGNPYNQSSPGILSMFALFGLVSSAQILVQERKSHTFERMLTTSLSSAGVVTGHFLAMATIPLLQQVLLVGFGQFLLGVNYLQAPVGTLLIMLALSFTTASIGLFIGVLSRDDSQVVLFSLIGMFIFSALGGAWFPIEVSGKAFATVAKFTPVYWAMTGFQNIVIRGLGSESALLPAGIMLAFSAVFFLLAVWRLRKE